VDPDFKIYHRRHQVSAHTIQLNERVDADNTPEISAEGLTAKEGLLLWCKRKTACYEEIDITDFSTSWNNGLALYV